MSMLYVFLSVVRNSDPWSKWAVHISAKGGGICRIRKLFTPANVESSNNVGQDMKRTADPQEPQYKLLKTICTHKCVWCDPAGSHMSLIASDAQVVSDHQTSLDGRRRIWTNTSDWILLVEKKSVSCGRDGENIPTHSSDFPQCIMRGNGDTLQKQHWSLT